MVVAIVTPVIRSDKLRLLQFKRILNLSYKTSIECIVLHYLHETFELKSKRSSLILKKTKSKKETKLVAQEGNENEKTRHKLHSRTQSRPKIFLNLLSFLSCSRKTFQATSFSLKLSLFLSKTNCHSNRFFFQIRLDHSKQLKKFPI